MHFFELSQQSLSKAQNEGSPLGSKFEQPHVLSSWQSPEQQSTSTLQAALTEPQHPPSAVSAALDVPTVDELSDEQPAPNVSTRDATARSKLEERVVCMVGRILRSALRVKLGCAARATLRALCLVFFYTASYFFSALLRAEGDIPTIPPALLIVRCVGPRPYSPVAAGEPSR